MTSAAELVGLAATSSVKVEVPACPAEVTTISVDCGVEVRVDDVLVGTTLSEVVLETELVEVELVEVELVEEAVTEALVLLGNSETERKVKECNT